MKTLQKLNFVFKPQNFDALKNKVFCTNVLMFFFVANAVTEITWY